MFTPIRPDVTKIQMVSDARQSVTARRVIDSGRIFHEVGGSIASVRQEIDDCFADIKTFSNREPDEVMRLVSGWSARFSELKVRIRRIEDTHREWFPVRDREIEPVLDELQQQYVIASRLLTVRELDYKMSLGQP